MAKGKAADAANKQPAAAPADEKPAGAASDATKDAAATEKPAPAANIKLAAKAEPLGAGDVTVGLKVIGQMPSEKEQADGWYCPFARQLMQLYPDRFRLIAKKGK